MKSVAVVGAGYVGLTTGAALAYLGHRVESPALELAALLLERGAFVRAHDPAALPRARREVSLPLEYAETPEAVVDGADAVVLATDWPEYRTWPWEALRPLLRYPLVVDARNHLDGERLVAAGYRYLGVGVPEREVRVGGVYREGGS